MERWIKDIPEGSVKIIRLMVKDSEERSSAGNPNNVYVNASMTDGRDSVKVKFWNISKQNFDSAYPAGTVLELPLKASVYNGKRTYSCDGNFGIVKESDVNLSDYVKTGKIHPEIAYEECMKLIDSIDDAHTETKRLLLTVFTDVKDMITWSAGAKMLHHDYLGGLLDHEFRMANIALNLPNERVNMDLISYEGYLENASRKDPEMNVSAEYIASHAFTLTSIKVLETLIMGYFKIKDPYLEISRKWVSQNDMICDDVGRTFFALLYADAVAKEYPFLDLNLMVSAIIMLSYRPQKEEGFLSESVLLGNRLSKFSKISAFSEETERNLSSVLMSTDFGNQVDYTTKGHLFGHIVLGIQILEDYITDSGVSKETGMLYKHIIASHHGKREWGAFTSPRIPEAAIVHALDMLDSRMNMYEKVMETLQPGEMTADRIFGLSCRVYKKA